MAKARAEIGAVDHTMELEDQRPDGSSSATRGSRRPPASTSTSAASGHERPAVRHQRWKHTHRRGRGTRTQTHLGAFTRRPQRSRSRETSSTPVDRSAPPLSTRCSTTSGCASSIDGCSEMSGPGLELTASAIATSAATGPTSPPHFGTSFDTQAWMGDDEQQTSVARFHHRLVAIHPFPNGNGRHSRARGRLPLHRPRDRAANLGSAHLQQHHQAARRLPRSTPHCRPRPQMTSNPSSASCGRQRERAVKSSVLSFCGFRADIEVATVNALRHSFHRSPDLSSLESAGYWPAETPEGVEKASAQQLSDSRAIDELGTLGLSCPSFHRLLGS